ncbi:MAG: hypothetical protein HZB34_00330 [Nitrospirae bacterium]|jgi:hypothetical protein|nr:hypothetical protein [Nitrospirota bacterium]
MDWWLILGLVSFLIVVAIASFYLYVFVSRTKKEFRAAQPDLRVTNMATMSSGNVLTVYPELQNLGGGVAYDCLLHMGGWEGNFSVKKIYPRGPKGQKHVASIVLGPDAPIRTTLMGHGYIRLRYLDRWGQKYDCWYQVTQVGIGDAPLYDIQIDLEHPELQEPHPSVWEMRRFLRAVPLPG